MVGIAGTLAILAIVGVNGAIAALATRFFRVRLVTRWGSLLYAVLLTPVPLFLVAQVSLVGMEAAGVTPDLGNPTTVLAVTIAVPLALGLTFDYFWMPAPEETELPDTA